MNNKENLFIIRTYTKAELAHLYNPTVCIKVALQILRRWILFNLPLLHELEAEGYRARNRLLSPKQVATIVQYLGEPWKNFSLFSRKFRYISLQKSYFAAD